MSKSSRLSSPPIIALLLVVFFFSFAAVHAQSADSNRKGVSPDAQKMLSADVVVLMLTMDDGTWFKITERVGSMIQIQGRGLDFGLVPKMDNGQISVVGYDIANNNREIGIINTATRLEAVKRVGDHAGLTNSDLPFTVDVIGLKKNTVQSGRFLLSGDRCCVTCNGVRVCACGVDSGCGNCCSGPCCPNTN